MNFKLWLENTEPFIAYHQTSLENAAKIKRSRRFSLKNSTQGIIWFTNDIDSLRNNTTGAQGSGAIIKLLVTINNPAGWKEYHDLMLGQLQREYDGAILPQGKTFDGFVFNPKQIKVLGIIPIDKLTEAIHLVRSTDHDITFWIDGKRYDYYIYDPFSQSEIKNIAHYRPGKALNKVKELVKNGNAVLEKGPY